LRYLSISSIIKVYRSIMLHRRLLTPREPNLSGVSISPDSGGHVDVCSALPPDLSPDQLRHVVRVAVPTVDGGYVMVRRLPTSRNNPGRWEFPGGKVESGATFAATAAEELAQEIGLHDIRIHPDQVLAYAYAMLDKPERQVYAGWHMWSETVISSCEIPNLRPQPEEVAEIGVFSLPEIRAMPIGHLTNMALRQTTFLQ
jgi:8-oxo-dGTP pyrophosphatase MutT (NUDIX family)